MAPVRSAWASLRKSLWRTAVRERARAAAHVGTKVVPPPPDWLRAAEPTGARRPLVVPPWTGPRARSR